MRGGLCARKRTPNLSPSHGCHLAACLPARLPACLGGAVLAQRGMLRALGCGVAVPQHLPPRCQCQRKRKGKPAAGPT